MLVLWASPNSLCLVYNIFCHVWRHDTCSTYYRIGCECNITLCRYRHVVVPRYIQNESSSLFGFQLCFLGGYASVKQLCVAQGLTDEMALNYACLGVAAASLLYFVMAFLLKMFGTDKVMRFSLL